MKVSKEYMIDGNVVEKVATFEGIEVYYFEDAGGDEITTYFVKNGNVVAKHIVTADCGQNMGYIADSEFKVIKEN